MPTLERLPENFKGRDFVVGDLHGSYEELFVELDRHCFDLEVDRLISVGDLIDRGAYSYQCLQLTEEPWFFTVWGNHEALMFKGLKDGLGSEAFRLWMQNGGEWALKYNLDELRYLIEKKAKVMPLAIELHVEGKAIGIAHAAVPSDDWGNFHNPLTPKQRDTVIWSRTDLLGALEGREPVAVRGVDYVIFGHTPLETPTRIGNRLYLDTGAGYINGSPTLMELKPSYFSNANTRPQLFSQA